MATLSADSLSCFEFDPRAGRYPYTPRTSWPVSVDPNPSRVASQRMANVRRSTSPIQGHTQLYEQSSDRQPQILNSEWQIPHSSETDLAYSLDTTFSTQYTDPYAQYQSPTELLSIQSHLDNNVGMEGSYMQLANSMESRYPFNWDIQDLMFTTTSGVPEMSLPQQSMQDNLQDNSPTFTNLEVRSITSCSSDNGWNYIENSQKSPNPSYQEPQNGAVFNPGQTLHQNRTLSESSYSDIELQSRQSWSHVETNNAISSPGTDSVGDFDVYSEHAQQLDHAHPHVDYREPSNPPAITTSTLVRPIDIRKPPSPQRSPISPGKGSPPGRRQSRKNTNPKLTKPIIQKPSQAPKVETEKRVGRRKGPLRPEQRKQACEIRKLGACLRCKFLKKTDWKADYERHVSLGFSVGNIKGFADVERTLFITHGYGHYLPVRAREVFVRDERCFGLDWVETVHPLPEEFSVNTAKLSAGMEGISTHLLSDYLDRHIDGGFEGFVDEYFEGTPFLTEMLKTAYHFWLKEKTPVIRKSLKLLLAYNLTQHVTMVQGIPDEEGFLGKITDETSKFWGQTVAPVMINFQIKCALADMWRELQKEILMELSRLYQSVYTRDKLKHWPTIFIVATILLGVWEEMQFDCHYRVPDTAVVTKFCNDMEATPVGVIVGLFAAISQKVPPLSDWDSRKHHNILNSNPAVCDALTEVRDHVIRHDGYLRQRNSAVFDRDDFDSLSGKFVSKLVIRAN
ncbi:hypothetical protein MMC29_006383 [Sticta canariensis]|nr:hypothetical protein [Sticta canariensis]